MSTSRMSILAEAEAEAEADIELGIQKKEGYFKSIRCWYAFRTLVYVEAEAQMNNYQDADGKNRSSMSAVQRKYPF